MHLRSPPKPKPLHQRLDHHRVQALPLFLPPLPNQRIQASRKLPNRVLHVLTACIDCMRCRHPKHAYESPPFPAQRPIGPPARPGYLSPGDLGVCHDAGQGLGDLRSARSKARLSLGAANGLGGLSLVSFDQSHGGNHPTGSADYLYSVDPNGQATIGSGSTVGSKWYLSGEGRVAHADGIAPRSSGHLQPRVRSARRKQGRGRRGDAEHGANPCAR